MKVDALIPELFYNSEDNNIIVDKVICRVSGIADASYVRNTIPVIETLITRDVDDSDKDLVNIPITLDIISKDTQLDRNLILSAIQHEVLIKISQDMPSLHIMAMSTPSITKEALDRFDKIVGDTYKEMYDSCFSVRQRITDKSFVVKGALRVMGAM